MPRTTRPARRRPNTRTSSCETPTTRKGEYSAPFRGRANAVIGLPNERGELPNRRYETNRTSATAPVLDEVVAPEVDPRAIDEVGWGRVEEGRANLHGAKGIE